MKKYGKKSLIVVDGRKDFPYNIPFIKAYFNIVAKYERDMIKDSPFTLFYNFSFNEEEKKDFLKDFNIRDGEDTGYRSEEEGDKFQNRFCIFSSSLTKSDFSFLFSDNDTQIKEKSFNVEDENTEFIEELPLIPGNITFLNTLKRKDAGELKNIYVGYLPLEEKLKVKKLLENGEKIYSDSSILEIL